MGASKLSSISQSDSLEKMGEFWDNHDFTDFDDPEAPDVEFEVRCAVPVDTELLTRVEQQARRGWGIVERVGWGGEGDLLARGFHARQAVEVALPAGNPRVEIVVALIRQWQKLLQIVVPACF